MLVAAAEKDFEELVRLSDCRERVKAAAICENMEDKAELSAFFEWALESHGSEFTLNAKKFLLFAATMYGGSLFVQMPNIMADSRLEPVESQQVSTRTI